jgi:VanZ family protein
LTFFATLASRRPVVVALVGMAFPVLVELTQAFLNVGRDCVGYDWVNNAIGALLGAVGGAAFMWAAHTAGRLR